MKSIKLYITIVSLVLIEIITLFSLDHFNVREQVIKNVGLGFIIVFILIFLFQFYKQSKEGDD